MFFARISWWLQRHLEQNHHILYLIDTMECEILLQIAQQTTNSQSLMESETVYYVDPGAKSTSIPVNYQTNINNGTTRSTTTEETTKDRTAYISKGIYIRDQ